MSEEIVLYTQTEYEIQPFEKLISLKQNQVLYVFKATKSASVRESNT